MLRNPKRCGCGELHLEVGPGFRVCLDPDLGGYYWECSCKSTLFVRLDGVIARKKVA